jgi:hypothetical protein
VVRATRAISVLNFDDSMSAVRRDESGVMIHVVLVVCVELKMDEI